MINHPRLMLRRALSPASKPTTIMVLAACLPMFFGACSFQKYSPKPIDPLVNLAKFEQKDPTGQSFHQYLMSNGYKAEQLPLLEWGIDELTYCAHYFHPSLDVARAQWRAAESAEASAAEKSAPTLNSNIARSDDSDPSKKPFAFGFSVDIPIETANKRDIRIANARHLSEIAKLEIAQTAWQLRHNIAQSLAEYQLNQLQIQLLTAEETRRQEIVAIYQKRLSLGAASNIELSSANLQLQSVSSSLHAAQQNALVFHSRLASNTGLPLTRVEKMQLSTNTNKPVTHVLQASSVQTTALLNRLDIRIALERYAAAETKLKLEIAKQYPDLVISPGYAFEFGDNVWSLGLSGLMTLLNKNKAGIAEAAQLREVEVAQFEALQTKVISEASIANAELIQAQQALTNQQKLLEQQQANTKRMERMFAAGEIDRLALAFITLENIQAEKSVALAYFKFKTAHIQLENTLQKPLTGAGVKNEP